MRTFLNSESQTRRIGVTIIAISFILFGAVFLVPFLSMSITQKSLTAGILWVASEVTLWIGGLLLGKSLMTRYKNYFNPAYWFRTMKFGRTDEKRTVLVFQTSVTTTDQVNMIKTWLDSCKDVCKWSFDLEDSDKILRIECTRNVGKDVVGELSRLGFRSEELR